MPIGAHNAAGVESLPPNLRNQVVDRLIAGDSSRSVSEYLLQQGHKLSHAAINRYNQNVVKPGLKVGAKLQKLEAANLNPRETAEVTAEFTKQALVASPIMARLDRKFARLDPALETAAESMDYDAMSKLEAAESKAIELLGKAILDPGFVASAPQQSTGTTVVVVMPTAADPRMQAWQQRQGVIEVVPDRDDSES